MKNDNRTCLLIFFVLAINACPDPSVCDSNAVCAFANGQPICSCRAGFSGNGKTCVGMYHV